MAQKKPKKSPAAIKAQSKDKKKITVTKIGTAIIILIIAVFFVMNNCNRTEPDIEYYTFKKEGELTFTDNLGNTKIKIDIEIADNEYERQLGLMNRQSMEENQGMLFIFPYERPQSFWMRNTLLSLDMIFVNSNKEIVTIHKNTKILSDQNYPSSEPATYVVEVVAGFTGRHNIIVGDKIYWMGTKINL